MIQISNSLYEETLNQLCAAIGSQNYLSGTIAFQAEGIACRLTTSVIVYRRKVSYPEGDADEIRDLVPVWWEFHTSKDNDECLNDFQFSAMKNFLT